ncbi:MAG: putative Ig domain-containing protein [Candidatus Solibacter usitatus]|nr:putative Ig domain-containing protein [Candidatus Solibacter usitatus]
MSGALPAGLSLNANCTITGTPTATGQATVIVQRVFNPNLQDTVPVSLQVVAALALSPTTLPNGSVGTSYSQPVTGSGGIPPYTLRLSSGSLPTGVSLQTTQTPTTTAYSLTGNPTAAGTFNFTLQLTDSAGNTSSTAYAITIGGRLAITTTSLPNGTVGVVYSQTVAATGGTPPYTFDVPPGSLPGGLSLSTAGVLSGTPATAGIAPLTVNVTDSARVAARQSLPLLIQLPAGTAGVAYSARLTIAGGAGPFTCALISGTLPAGLALTANGCLIDQTPTTAGSFPFMLRISDPGGSPQTMQQSITILPALTLAPATLPSGTFGAAYSASLTATGGVGPYTFTTVQGTSLPGGLSLAANGQISGTPNAAGTFTFMAQVADSGVLFPARVTRAYTITIAPPPVTQLTITTPAQVMPAQQSNVSVQLAPAYPLPLTGTLTLTFNPDAVVPVDDPNVVFSNASRTVAFTIPANATQGVFTSPVMVQTGTVAGDIRLTARLMQGATDVTPSPAPVQTIRLNRTAPGITSVRVVRTAPGFDVIVIGHSTPRDMSQAGFAFTGTSSLQTTAVTVPATQLFTTWYQSANSGRFGSEFQFTQSFTVQGDISAIRSVAVTLTNSTVAGPSSCDQVLLPDKVADLAASPVGVSLHPDSGCAERFVAHPDLRRPASGRGAASVFPFAMQDSLFPGWTPRLAT